MYDDVASDTPTVICSGCTNRIPVDSKKCPVCGQSWRKSHGPILKPFTVLVLFAVILVSGVFVVNGLLHVEPSVDTESPEELARRKKVAELTRGWERTGPVLETHIKGRMHDPDSFEHIETSYRDNGDRIIVSTTFRAKDRQGETQIVVAVGHISLDGHILYMAPW